MSPEQDRLADDPGYAAHIDGELERIRGRRVAMGARPALRQDGPWALSLSGGGIRSATFCLGVLQALAHSAPPTPSAPPAQEPDGAQPPSPAPEASLLGQMDYLSTVSGGGYIGTFFVSLFVPRRALMRRQAGAPQPATEQQAWLTAAAAAYDTLRQEPPRMHASAVQRAGMARNAMAWLRENGRYLAPSSGGDMLYSAATAVRAWAGLHPVIGLLLLVLLLLLGLGKNALFHLAASFDRSILLAPFEPEGWRAGIWLSGLWIYSGLTLLALVVPTAGAYWLTYPPPDRTLTHRALQPRRFWIGYGATMLIIAAALVPAIPAMRTVAIFLLGAMASSAVWFMLARRRSRRSGTANLKRIRILTFAELRVRLTRQLTRWLKLGGVLGFLALVDTLSQSAYLREYTVALPLGATATLTWLVRRMAPLSGKIGDVRRVRIPAELLFTAGAVALATLLVSLWDYGIIWLLWEAWRDPFHPYLPAADMAVLQHQYILLGLGLLVTVPLTVLIGQYPQFLNLSSLQNLYSARLTRAYHGASNGKRFDNAGKDLSSAEPLRSDHISHEDYNANPYAPLHIINVCLNQNVDPAEQLVQRDRKGRPLAVLPAASTTAAGNGLSFAIDGKLYVREARDGDDKLTIGEWIGVSGAAAATGSGRRTSASLALLLGLANVRLGRWWCSGVTHTERRAPESERARASGSKGERLFRKWLPTQAYLADELGAQFYGTRRPRHYLSDGGHFENTGIYEMLRKARQVRLLVCCDCGADPLYRFDDLANLIRLARIDFQIEIEVDESVAGSLSQLRHVFGTPAELARPEPGSNKCALLLNVYRSPDARRRREPDMRIVLIKPVMIAAAPLDVHNYRATNPAFPQQTTGDQFFDEAQWESYRKLGLEIGRQIFDSDNLLHRERLWKLLL